MQAARPKLTKNGSTPGGKPEPGKSVNRMPVILQVNSSGPPQRAGHTVTRHIARVASSTCHAVGPPSQHCHKAYWSGSGQSRANVATFPRMKTLQENEHACSCFASLVGCTKEKEGASQLQQGLPQCPEHPILITIKNIDVRVSKINCQY